LRFLASLLPVANSCAFIVQIIMATALFQMRSLVASKVSRGSVCSLAKFATRSASSAVVKYSKRGQPTQCLAMESEDVNLTSLGATDIAVQMIAAPINPSDLNMVEGSYDILPSLPAVGGNEGVAKVTGVGSAVKDLSVGDWVIPANPGFGTWRQAATGAAADFLKVPPSLPAEYAACLSVNPCTAFRLLRDFQELGEGDVIIQNGANSMVGMAVIQMAKARGITTVNVVRNRPQGQEVMQFLKDLGGDVVCFDEYVNTYRFERLMADLPKPKLALNCVGGPSAANLARALGPHGTLVTYGGMSRQPVTLPASALMHNNVTARGFWMSRWNREASRAEREAMVAAVAGMMEDGTLDLWVERHPFADFAHALRKASEPFRFRKVVLTMLEN